VTRGSVIRRHRDVELKYDKVGHYSLQLSSWYAGRQTVIKPKTQHCSFGARYDDVPRNIIHGRSTNLILGDRDGHPKAESDSRRPRFPARRANSNRLKDICHYSVHSCCSLFPWLYRTDLYRPTPIDTYDTAS